MDERARHSWVLARTRPLGGSPRRPEIRCLGPALSLAKHAPNNVRHRLHLDVVGCPVERAPVA
jgi:hypothetical protein